MIEDLERKGLIRGLPVDARRVSEALGLARRDLVVAKSLLETDLDWAYTIAYNAVLQAGRALMFSQGYRPENANQHISVVLFCEHFLEKDDAAFFNRMRRKRNVSVYDAAGSVSEIEAQHAVQRSEDLKKIEALIRT